MPADEDKKIDERDEILDRYLKSKEVKPLDSEEVKELRAMLEEYQRSAWLKKKIMVGLPWLIGVIGAVATALSFLVNWKVPK